MLATTFAAGTLVVSGACGPPPPASAPPPLEVPAVAAADAGTARDTRPLPTFPKGTTAVLRIRDFTGVASEIYALMGAPPSFDATVLLHSLVDPDVLTAVDVSAPMDGLNIENPHRTGAAAFTLRTDGESILRERFDLRGEGALVHLVKKEGDRTKRGMSACALHEHRLVCAYDAEALSESAPYLVTTLGAEPLDHAIRLIVPGATVRQRAHTKSGPIEDRLATDLVLGFEREIDRIDVDWDLGATVEATLTLHLLSREAALTRALVPIGRIGPSPPTFDRLPSGALLAIWSNGVAADDLAPLKNAIADDLQTTLEADGYPPEAAKASIDELRALFLTGGPFVLAAGKTKSTWLVAGVEEPSTRWTNGLRALVKKSDEAERTRKKPANPVTRRRPDGDDVAARVVPVPASAKLSPDSLHIELKFTPRKGTGQVRIAHLWVVPQGDRTWIGYGDDDPAVRERLRGAREPNSAASEATPALVSGQATMNGLAMLLAPDKSVIAGGGEDRISMSVVTDPKTLVVRMRGPRQAALDFAKTFF